jgi:hypothetical protein
MIVAVTYQFHDYEPKSLIIDTSKLNVNHLFEKDFKEALENNKSCVVMDGEKYQDNWGDIDKAKVNASTNKVKNIHVFWDC